MGLGANPSDTSVSGSWYDFLGRIGSGGMATIHVGRRRGARHFAPLVAIKRLHPHLTGDRSAREAMLDEAAIGLRLQHPNAVRVHDVEDLGTELLLVMDYVEGASVADLLARTPLLPRPVAIRIVLDAAAGLSAMHELGAVHRDVAPDNLLVGVDGWTRIADYGVAKCPSLEKHMTDEGVLKGRFAYMAPEYLMGYPTDGRADVFALAALAWELLAGKNPFQASTAAATMQRVARLEVPRLSSAALEIGGAFDAVLGRALAKNPNLRFPNMTSFARELAAAAVWAGGVASPEHVGVTIHEVAGDDLALRQALIDGALAQMVEPSGVRSTYETLHAAAPSAYESTPSSRRR